MRFLDNLLVKLKLKSQDELDYDTISEENSFAFSEAGDVIGNNENPEDEHQGLNNRKILMAVTGLAVFVCAWTFFSTQDNQKSDKQMAAQENIVKVPNLAQNPVSVLPDTYAEIGLVKNFQKEKQEKKVEETQVPPSPPQIPIVQEQPILTEYERNEEKQMLEEQSRILSSKIAFDLTQASENSQTVTAKYKKSINNAKSGWTLMAGSVIPATMLTGATSDMPNSDVVAQVRQDVYDSKSGKYILIPQGTKVIGTSGTFSMRGNKRLGIVFNRLVFPNGASVDLPNQNGIDGPGMPGLQDKYTQHSSTMMRTAILSAAFAAAAQSATKGSGGTDYTASAGQEAVSGAVSDIMDVADQIINRDVNIQPSIIIRPGTQFAVFLNKDFVFKEYKQ